MRDGDMSCVGVVKDPKFVCFSVLYVGILVVCLSPLYSVERIHICT